MDPMLLPGARRDNGGFISVPIDIPRGCKGPACPAFALCQGRCTTRRSSTGKDDVPQRHRPETFDPQ
jgi:hypothetical protein